MRKTQSQIENLLDIFINLRGPITKQVRQVAVKRTGLKWNKIYKWLFDHSSKLPIYRSFEMLISMESSEFRQATIFKTERHHPLGQAAAKPSMAQLKEKFEIKGKY